MEIKLEGKTLVIGVLVGVVITIVLGVDGVPTTVHTSERIGLTGSADKTDYGLAVNDKGLSLVRVESGDFFVINPQTAMAIRVLHSRRFSDDSTRSRDARGKIFNYFAPAPKQEDTPKDGY